MHKIKIPAARFAAFMAEAEPVAVAVLSSRPARRVEFGTFDVPLRARLIEKEVVDRAPEVKEANFAERYFATVKF